MMRSGRVCCSPLSHSIREVRDLQVGLRRPRRIPGQPLFHCAFLCVLCSQAIRLPVQPAKVRRWLMTMDHPVITDVGLWGEPPHASSVVKAPVGAGRATPPGRSMKRMLQLRYGNLAGSETRGDVVAESVQRWRRPASARKTSSSALAGTPGVRATARGERIGRVKWGSSGGGGLVPRSGGIVHEPLDGFQRRRCGQSKQRSDRTIQPIDEPRATGLAVLARSPRCRLVARPITDQTPRMEIPTVTACERNLSAQPEYFQVWELDDQPPAICSQYLHLGSNRGLSPSH